MTNQVIEMSMEDKFEVARLKASMRKMSRDQLADLGEGLVIALFAERAAKKWLIDHMLRDLGAKEVPDSITVNVA